MSDRTGPAALDQTAATFNGQRGITVGHRTGLSARQMGDLAVLILPPKDPFPYSALPASTTS
jgi:hypothetical protein